MSGKPEKMIKIVYGDRKPKYKNNQRISSGISCYLRLKLLYKKEVNKNEWKYYSSNSIY